MIVDCHTHIWQSPEQLGAALLGDPASLVRGQNRLGGNSLQLCTYESSWYDDKIQLLATWVPNCPVIGLDANA